MSWDSATGYVIDTEYTRHVFREMLPFSLRHALAARGLPSRLAETEEIQVCELGCGVGLNSLAMAAAHPLGRFYGVDLNPAHVAGACRLAAQAGLTNVQFLENTFAELLEQDLPAFDMICLHGVYSWIAPEHRAQVVDFIAEKLKPAGVVYVSYNTLPGWSTAAPLRQLMLDYTAGMAVSSSDKAKQALGLLNEMASLDGRYFIDNPRLKPMLERMGRFDPRYLAHEYLNEHWNPQYSAEVAAEMGRARLGWATDAEFSVNCAEFWINDAMKAFLDKARNPTQRETWKDYLLNTQFRRDVFVKGRQETTPLAREALLSGFHFGAFGSLILADKLKIGHTELTPGEVMKQVFAWLVESPRSLADLFTTGRAADLSLAKVNAALRSLLAANLVSPCIDAPYGAKADGAPMSLARANQAFLDDALLRSAEAALVSPLTRGPRPPLPILSCLILSAMLQNVARPALVPWVRNELARRSLVLNEDNQPVREPQAVEALLQKRILEFGQDTLPGLIRAGIVV